MIFEIVKYSCIQSEINMFSIYTSAIHWLKCVVMHIEELREQMKKKKRKNKRKIKMKCLVY